MLSNEQQKAVSRWQLTECLLVLFVWLVFALLCGSPQSDNTIQAAALGKFAGGAAILLSVVAVAALGSSTLRELTSFIFVANAALSTLPVLAFEELSHERELWLTIFYSLLVSAPVLFRIWSLQWQIASGVIAVLSIGFLTLPPSSVVDFHPIAIVLLSAILAALILYVRRQSTEERILRAEEDALRVSLQLSRQQLPKKLWQVVMLQAYLLIVLLFLNYIFVNNVTTTGAFYLGHFYALLVIGFEVALLNIVKPAYLALTTALMTALVGIVLIAFTGDCTPAEGLLRATLPVVYLCFTTANLPWSLSYQIVLGWVLIVVGFVVKTGQVWQGGQAFDAAVGEALQRYETELSLLVAGVALAVFTARIIRQHSLANLSPVSDRGVVEAVDEAEGGRTETVRQFCSVVCPSQVGLALERSRRLIWGVLCLGLYSNLFSTVILLQNEAVGWQWSLVGWLIFLPVWVVLLLWQRSQGSTAKLWQLASLLAVLLFLWPGVILISAQPSTEFWYLWPFCLFVGLAFVPWAGAELIPLVVTNTIAGVEIVRQLSLGATGVLLIVVSTIVSLYFAIHNYRRLKEHYLLNNFHAALSAVRDENETVRSLADYLLSLFDSSTALIWSDATGLELVRGARGFLLAPDTWPIRYLRKQQSAFHVDEKGIGIQSVNWLPMSWTFFDRRFGVVSGVNGVLFELNCVNSEQSSDRRDRASGGGVGEVISAQPGPSPSLSSRSVGDDELRAHSVLIEAGQSYLLFVTSAAPVFSLLRAGELALARSLCALALLKFEVFREERLRGAYQKYSELTQVEREYELSTLVHDINNTVQDLTLLCDSALEVISGDADSSSGETTVEQRNSLNGALRRIATIARSMATVVSDSKRKRELERLQDLTPRELIEINETLEELVSYATVRAERKRIVVRSVGLGSEKLWTKISAREHLDTILRNLLNNAVMYSNPGSTITVTIRHQDEHGRDLLRKGARSVCIDVQDNGPGLSAEECKAIFIPGYRGRTAATVPGGLGLGLSQSRRVAESAGGSLEVSSPGAGMGSTFTITLPRSDAPAVASGGRSWALMVDDQPVLTESYAKIARALNFLPIVASSVDEAIAQVEARGKPSFVLTDLHLGNSYGLDLVKYLREQFGSALPILVVSGINDQETETKVRQMGATDFVSKPIGRRALFARIESLLPSMQ